MMSSPPSPKMSQQQQHNIPARQVRNHSYSSPSYPSPSMSAYAYPPPNGQNSEYQGSPTSSHQSLPSGVALPPLRTMDARSASQPSGQTSPGMASVSQAAPPAQQQPGAMGSPLPPPIPHMPQQYYPNIPPPAHGMSDPNQPMRFPLAPDNRMMSGGRHKKEIKRRTKTGCLTCRKRRIKVRRFPSLFANNEHRKVAQKARATSSAMKCSCSRNLPRGR